MNRLIYTRRPSLGAALAAAFLAAAIAQTPLEPVLAAESTAATASAGIPHAVSIQSVQVGDIAVKAIYDSPQVFEKAIFPGIDAHPDRLALMPNGHFVALTKTYYVETAGRKVLFDGGWGKDSGINALTLDSLRKLGVSPSDVTDIFVTHLDVDHISGLITKGNATYPNAVLQIAGVEFDAWMHDMDREPEYIALAKRVAKAYGERIRTFEYGDEIVPGITPRAARGHTFGHTRYDIDSKGVGMTIVGDLIHVAPIQMRWTDYCTIYDAHPTMAAAAREAALADIAKKGRIFAGMHIKEIGRIKKDPKGGYRFSGK